MERQAVFRSAVRADTLWPGEMIGCVVGGHAVLIANVDGTVVAFQDRCAHLGTPLSAGRLNKDRIVCRAHHWEYDARTGAGVNPKTAALVRYPVDIVNGFIHVDVDA